MEEYVNWGSTVSIFSQALWCLNALLKIEELTKETVNKKTTKTFHPRKRTQETRIIGSLPTLHYYHPQHLSVPAHRPHLYTCPPIKRGTFLPSNQHVYISFPNIRHWWALNRTCSRSYHVPATRITWQVGSFAPPSHEKVENRSK
jgi:hypothetical protein